MRGEESKDEIEGMVGREMERMRNEVRGESKYIMSLVTGNWLKRNRGISIHFK